MKTIRILQHTKFFSLNIALIILSWGLLKGEAKAQPTVLYTSSSNWSPSPSNSRFTLNTFGIIRQVRLQATASATSSTLNWAFHTGTTASPNYNPCWRPTASNQVMSLNNFIPTNYNNGAKYQTGGGNDGWLPAITNGNYYTFNVSAGSTSNNVMSILETSYNPNGISTVSQYPSPGSIDQNQSVTIRMVSSGLPNVGEYFYVRYSTNSFSTSNFTMFRFQSNEGLASIPAQTAGSNVSYYILSSNKDSATLAADVAGNGQIAFDIASLNLNNNGGSNYSYSVASASGPLVLYTNMGSTTPSLTNFRIAMNYVAGFRQARLKANAGIIGNIAWAFHVGTPNTPNYSPCYRPGSLGVSAVSLNTFIPITSSDGAKYQATGGGQDGLVAGMSKDNYYTFNVSNNTTSNNVMQILETSFNPVFITSMTQMPASALINNMVSPRITITTSAAPASGENVYLRYSSNGFTSSMIVKFNFTGNTGTAYIGNLPSGTNVSYYIFSSNKSLSQLTTDATNFGQGAYDMATLNLLNNSNMNYQYTVNASTNPILVQSTLSPGSNTSYATLNAAFTAINNGTHKGDINIFVSNNTTEAASCVLNASGTGSALYSSIVINPIAGIECTITGSGLTTLPLIDLSGADRVTIDGLNKDGNALTITNPSVHATAMTIRFAGDACRNSIQNCKILGSNTATTGAPFGTIHFSTGTTTGNDSNVISNNLIGNASGGLPAFGIYSYTNSATISNDTIIVANNEIYNYFSNSTAASGIFLDAGSSITSNSYWNISGNKFYQTSARNSATSGNIYRSIRVGNSSSNVSGGGHNISNNLIGFASNSRTGLTSYGPSSPSNYGYRFVGIDCYLGTAANTTITGNCISGISVNTTSGATGSPGIFTGICLNTGIATISNDTIGYTGAGNTVTTTTSGAAIWGIYAQESTGTPSISNNYVGTFSTGGTASILYSFTGIQIAGVANSVVSGNVIGGTNSNDISIGTNGTTTATSGSMYGINCTASGAPTIQNNIIRNVTLNSSGTSSSSLFLRGIEASGGGSIIISGNQIYNLTNNGLATGGGVNSGIIGIYQNNTTATSVIVNSNSIYNLNATPSGNTAITMIGMLISGPATGTYTIQKNNVHSFKLSSTTSSTMQGIKIVTGAPVVANNMIRLGIDASGVALTGDYAITGLDASLGASAIYNNSIYIGGSTAGTTNTSYAIHAGGISSVTAVKNNIAWNARTNGGAQAGKHIALAFRGSTGAANITNNLILADTVNGGTLARNTSTLTSYNSLASLILSGFNNNGVSSNPQFINASGTSATGDLHISTSNATEIEAAGTPVSGLTDDYDSTLRNATNPDIGADEGSFIIGDFTPPSISYTSISNLTGTSAPAALSVTITDKSGVKSVSGSKPRLYYKKCSDANQIVGNTSTDNGWKYVEATNFTSPFTFNMNYSIIYGGAVSQGTIVNYFVVAQDSFSTPNEGISDNLSFGTAPTSVALATANLPTANTNAYVHQMTSGNFSVGTGETFTSITGNCGCFRVMNASSSSLTGNVTLSVTSDLTESGEYGLTTSGPSNVSTLSIVPSSANTYTISGTVSDGSTASNSTSFGLIKMSNGAKLKIDGRYSGTGRYLLFRNTSATAANTAPVVLLNGGTSCNLDINYAIFEGNNQYSTGSTFGAALVNVFTSGGNATIKVDSSIFRDARGGTSGMASSGIYVNSSNASVTITNNLFDNIYNNPVQVYISGTAVINNNSIFASSTLSAPTLFYGINVGSNGGGPYTVNNNTIGGSAANGSGSPLTISSAVDFKAIYLSGSATYNVQGDTIENINLTNTSGGSFTGIHQATGSLNTGTGNVIGHHSNSALGITFNSNATHYGIYQAGTTNSTNTVSNNIIANLVSNSTGTANMLRGILGNYTTGTPTISGNIIHDLITMSTSGQNVASGTSAASANSALSGIIITGSSTPSNISVFGNTIYALKANNTGSANTSVIGIEAGSANNGASLNSIYQNNIYGLENKSTATTSPFGSIVGIRDYDKVWTFANNTISLTNGSNTNNIWVYGFMEGATSTGSGITRIQQNSIYIGGTNAAGTANSAAYNNFYASSSNTDSVKNNIFVNVRTSSGSATAKHYAIEFSTNPTTMSQYCGRKNVLFASNPATLCYSTSDKTFTTWKALGASFDATSLNVPVYFTDPLNGNMHTSAYNCLLDGIGESILPAVSAVDMDNAPRNTAVPDIGADEFSFSNISGNMTVNANNTPDGGTKFVSLTSNYGGLFNALNTCAVNGNMNATISSDITEPGDNALNQWTETGGSNFRLRITSDGTTRTLSNTLYTGSLFKVNGADRVTIDGGNRNLIFASSNTTTANANLSTWKFSGNATADSFMNAVVKTETDVANEGNIYIGTGTNSVVIINNLLTNLTASDYPMNNIYSAVNTNTGTVLNNECANSGDAAIQLSNIAGGFNISGNSVYRTINPTSANYTAIAAVGSGVISGNYIGGQQAGCNGAAMPLTYTAANYNFTGISANGAGITGNTVQNISVSNGSNLTGFVGIKGIDGAIQNNTVGHATNASSIQFAATSGKTNFTGIQSEANAGALVLKQNTVANVSVASTTNDTMNRMVGIGFNRLTRPYGPTGTAVMDSISDNLIDNLSHAGANSLNTNSSFINGILDRSISQFFTGNGNSYMLVIHGNQVSNLKSTNTGGVVSNIRGIAFGNGTGIRQIQKNRVYGFVYLPNVTPACGSMTGISLEGIVPANLYNNMVSLSNTGSTVRVDITGVKLNNIPDQEDDTLNLFYNSIFVGGTQSGATGNSKALSIEGGTATFNSRNNVLFEGRKTNSFGNDYVMEVKDVLSFSSNNNLYVSPGSDVVRKYGYVANLDFNTWKAISGQDGSSYDTSSVRLNPDTLFMDKTQGDLRIRTDRTAAWYVNGKGVAGSLANMINSDFEGDNRETTFGYGTDIGADEMEPTTLPIPATQFGNIQTGDSTTYIFANRVISKIKWKTLSSNSGAYPSSLTARYYTGATPPDPTNAGKNPSAKYMDAYWTLTPTGGSYFVYDVALFYDEALMGTVSSENDMKLGKKSETGTGDWKVHFGSVTNASSNRIDFTDLNGFSVFTGSDNLSPLPVQLARFNAVARNSDAELTWETIAEQHSDVFVVLRSIGNGDFKEIGRVGAAGNSLSLRNYQFIDEAVAGIAQGASVHYMIRMLDMDGSATLSEVRSVQFGTAVSVSAIFPQPANDQIQAILNLSADEKLSIGVCDLSGKILIEEQGSFRKGAHQIQFNTSALASGIYLLRISNGQESTTYKFLKK